MKLTIDWNGIATEVEIEVADISAFLRTGEFCQMGLKKCILSITDKDAQDGGKEEDLDLAGIIKRSKDLPAGE